MMTQQKHAKPVRREGENGWARRIARKATETGDLLIDWDFHDEFYFVTDCDIKEAVVLEKSVQLAPLLRKYGFEDSDLL